MSPNQRSQENGFSSPEKDRSSERQLVCGQLYAAERIYICRGFISKIKYTLVFGKYATQIIFYNV